jgi:hypothetical protein
MRSDFAERKANPPQNLPTETFTTEIQRTKSSRDEANGIIDRYVPSVYHPKTGR